MEYIAQYQVQELIYESQRNQIYRAMDHDGDSVVLKILREENLTTSRKATFEKEFRLLSRFDSDLIIRAKEIIVHQKAPVIVFHDNRAISLKSFLERNKTEPKPINLKKKIEIAIEIAKALGEVHNADIIHKDINPHNILINPNDFSVCISDFGLASELSFERHDTASESYLEGTLSYISPEQTGRMNRDVDYRSDYYSLGTTLYELFCNKLPYEHNSLREIIHSHIAIKAKSIHEINSEIPQALAGIISKLMAKNPEDRYQGAFGIIYDLNFCLEQLNNQAVLETFSIAQQDISEKFRIPQNLYGRDDEIEKVTQIFEELGIRKSSYITITGKAGVGKSSLAAEILKQLSFETTLVLTGRFEQFKQNTPYSAIIDAYSDLINKLITESESELSTWRYKIREAVSENGKLITDLIPNLEKIIGEQRPPTELPAKEAQTRFIVTLQKFMVSFAGIDTPLVLFLDDLHWADYSSLEIIRNILLNDETGVLIIGAYRQEELTAESTLVAIHREIEAKENEIVELELQSLSISDIEHLIIDTINLTEIQVKELAQICLEKTYGNPFFINDFLYSQYKKRGIWIDTKAGKWLFDAEQLAKTPVSDNVAFLMGEKIKSLPIQTQNILKTASCIGSSFDLDLISELENFPQQYIIDALETALHESFIFLKFENIENENSVKTEKLTYNFLHDRVKTAAYSLLSEEEKNNIHLQIGRILYKKHKDNKLSDHAFEVTLHLNKCLDKVNEEEKIPLLKLNLEAAQKAKSSGAFSTYQQYVYNALHLTEEELWNTNYLLALSMYNQAAEAAYLLNFQADLDVISVAIKQNTKDILDQSELIEIRTLNYFVQNKLKEAIEEALGYLKKIGIHISPKANEGHMLLGLMKTIYSVKRTNHDKLLSLQLVKDRKASVAMKILAVTLHPAYNSSQVLFGLINFKVLQLTIKHGLGDSSPLSIMMYGMLRNLIFGKIDESYDFGQLGLKLLPKLNSKRFWAETSVFYNLAVRIWKEPVQGSIVGLLDDYKLAIETGDLEFAVSSLATSVSYQFFCGYELNAIWDSIEKYNKTLSNLPPQSGMLIINTVLQTIHSFKEATEHPEILKGEKFDEHVFLEQQKQENNISQMLNVLLMKTIIAVHMSKFHLAHEYIKEGRKYLQGLAGLLHFALFHTYESISLIRNYSKMSATELQKAKFRVRLNQRKVSKWMKHSPENFASKYYLVEAERSFYDNKMNEAISYYHQAIQEAKDSDFVNEEALAASLAGQNFASKDLPDFASLYFGKAYRNYSLWGATTVIEMLVEKYPDLNPHTESTTVTISRTFHGSEHSSDTALSIDLETLMDSAKTISGEIVLSELVQKSLRIILEHSGANKGCLVLQDQLNGSYHVVAEGSIEGGEIDVSMTNEKLTNEHLPISVARYVARTRQSVVLQNASQNEQFLKDLYIQKYNTKSVICIPIIQSSELKGALYVENSLIENAFTPQRINVLTLLCTQLAISIENAQHYNIMEQKVDQRTKELNEKKDVIEKHNKEIMSSISYAKRIQDAMMLPDEQVREIFKDSFILFKPRDVVSGDFYWVAKQGNKKIIAAVDCTGHGVPGAFMSILGISFLNSLVQTHNFSEPAEVLDSLRSMIKTALRQTSTTKSISRDGMDMSLCVIETDKKILRYAGAYNPMWLIRKATEKEGDSEIRIFKADKMPIGSMPRGETNFTQQDFRYESGDKIYLFSDGYGDQMNPSGTNKYKAGNLRKFILRISHLDMYKQKLMLNNEFNRWKGSMRQIDDVLVIGILLD